MGLASKHTEKERKRERAEPKRRGRRRKEGRGEIKTRHFPGASA